MNKCLRGPAEQYKLCLELLEDMRTAPFLQAANLAITVETLLKRLPGTKDALSALRRGSITSCVVYIQIVLADNIAEVGNI